MPRRSNSGYYSSSDSESEVAVPARRRIMLGSGPPPPAPVDKKKKKKKLPPQQTIDKIWKAFSRKRFSKALAVLPFVPVAAPSSPELANELLSVGFERAADECRRKVRKIIQECRRVNTRYRDPGFDLDWDFKMMKANCLNSLGDTKFDLSASSLVSPSATIPKAVKRVHEIFERPTFMKTIAGSDVKQGSLGDCWFMASLTALAGVEDAIKRTCVEYDTRIGIYGFVFFRDGEWIYSIVDDKLYLKSPCWDSPSMQRDLLQQIDREDVERVYRGTYQTGSKALFFAQNKEQNETWIPLIQKAYAKAHGDFASLTGGWIGEGLEDLSGGVTTELLASDILDTESFWDDELSRVNQEFLFGCSTGLLDGGYGDRDGISEGHAYNILEARTLKNGTRLLKLRNPWGKVRKGNWEGAWSDGSKEWTTEVKEELGHSFGGDSVFWISYDDLLRKYQHFDRTRLFRDPDWRCCQRWIGVDVPWKAVYNEKFHIKLTKDSPLVLVLSQLDGRYFKGLQGQYSFRLHFRVHEQDRPGAEDYIVRSHGNYLMERSVTIEIPNMAAGNYSIFVSVSAERDSKLLSIEDVVKRECRKRVENEKLAQVGHAHDLAHSKASAHLEELAKIRKKTDQKNASDARKSERRRTWEKRHLTKDIQKRQAEKNAEKKRKREEAEEAERQKKEAAAAEERKKKEEAEATEAKKKVEAEAIEAKKKEEAEAIQAKQKEAEEAEVLKKKEAEEAERKKKEAAEAEEREKAEEAKPKDKAVQTDADTPKTQGEDKDIQAEMVPEHDEEQDKDGVISVSSSGCSTPQSETPPVLATGDDAEDVVTVPPAETKDDGKVEEKAAEKPSETADENAVHTTGEKTAETTGSEETTKTNETIGETSEATAKTSETTAEASKTAAEASEKTVEAGEKTVEAGEKTAEASEKTTETSGTNGDEPVEKPIAPPSDASSASKNPTVASHAPPKPAPGPAPQRRAAKPPPPPPQQQDYSSDDSSDSPLEDWEELYSSDDLSHKPRLIIPGAPVVHPVKEEDDDSDDEHGPAAWNAICVVGFRVYSKDEGLELRVVMEGGSLAQDGRGEKGAQDIDDAQSNAGGPRLQEPKDDKIEEGNAEDKTEDKTGDKTEDKAKDKTADAENDPKEGSKEQTAEGEEKPDVDKGADEELAPYQTIVQKDGEEFEKASAPVDAKDSDTSDKDTTTVTETTPETVKTVVIPADDNSLYWG